MITDGLWRRRFGASPSLVGQKILFSGSPFIVAGVLPPLFHFPKNGELGPLTRLAERTEAFFAIQSFNQGWGGDFDYIVFARLRPGETQARGTAQLNLLERRIVDAHSLAVGLHVETRPLQDVIASPVRTSLAVLLAAVLVLVLIVCVNLANLLLARGSARAREFSLRIALGAARGRLVISALTETLLLSLAGGALGVAGAWAAVNAFARLAPIDLPRADEAHVDARVIAFAFGLSLLCAVLFGLLPALRLSGADPQSVLRGETHTSTGGRAGLNLREWLVGAEVALSTLLLVLAGLLVNSLWHVLHVDRGFASERTLDVSLMLPSKYRAVTDRAAFFDRAVAALSALPGARLAAAVNKLPLTGESNVNDVEADGLQSTAVDPSSRQLILVNDRFVGDQYFAAMGIPLLRGRFFEPADSDRNVAVISARLASKLWPGQNPLGHAVTSGSSIHDAQIVGVVGDVHTTQLERDPTMMIYVPFWRSAYQVSDLVIRSSIDPHALEQDVRRTIQSLDSGHPRAQDAHDAGTRRPIGCPAPLSDGGCCRVRNRGAPARRARHLRRSRLRNLIAAPGTGRTDGPRRPRCASTRHATSPWIKARRRWIVCRHGCLAGCRQARPQPALRCCPNRWPNARRRCRGASLRSHSRVRFIRARRRQNRPSPRSPRRVAPCDRPLACRRAEGAQSGPTPKFPCARYSV